MKYTALEIANILQGNVIGDSSIIVNSISKIEEGKKGDLCFLSNPKYNSFLYTTEASAVIVNKDFKPTKEISTTLIHVEDAYSAFSQLIEIYSKINFNKKGIDKKAHISDDSIISESSYIAPFVFIGNNVEIGENVQIFPHCFIGDNVKIKNNSILFSGVKIYNSCKIGENNILHSGVVIGSDGFGFAQDTENKYQKISQIGNVEILDNVEIGANTTIDRATLGTTKIGKGVKMDNQIQIAHNVEIDENTVIAALTAVAGSTKIGKNCMIGGQCAIAGHLTIADNVKVAGNSGIASSISEKGKVVQGSMAFNIKDFQRSYILFKKLPEIVKSMEIIKKEFQNQ
jgi:UDP-3-O-[3-hydroxymyristoyl] glucosamine N-acyltransferase